MRFLLTLWVVGYLCSFGSAFAGESLGRKYSSPVRIEESHLAGAHADAVRDNSSRRSIGKMYERHTALRLKDFRAIFHAHAGDSAHTGGTPEELLEAAHKTGLQVVFLSDHFRPPKDFMEGWRGMKNGVLFIPGSESNGFLVHPDASVFDAMRGPKEELIAAVNAGTGMLFLSHVEEKVDWNLDGVTGMEIYNRHFDAMDDEEILMFLVTAMTRAGEAERLDGLRAKYPDELFAAQHDYPHVYMEKWDAETLTRRVVGVGANDCHHNNVLILKMKDADTAIVGTNIDDDDEMRELPVKSFPGLKEIMAGHGAGDILARFDLDPYPIAIGNVSTHILGTKLNEAAIRESVAEGHAYVSHDWMCDPRGFLAWLESGDGETVAILGDEVEFEKGYVLKAAFPVECQVRVLRNGEVVEEATPADFEYTVTEKGVYRVEGWLSVDGEDRSWIYANPIYIR